MTSNAEASSVAVESPMNAESRGESPTSSVPSSHSKPCTICAVPRDVLIRCQIDESGVWHFVCPGKCWKDVSGGAIDGDDEHKHYRYGGTWKNKHDAVSGKKKKKKGGKQSQDVVKPWQPPSTEDEVTKKDDMPLPVKYSQNDKVMWEERLWICRRSHIADWDKVPGDGWRYWKEGE